MTYEHARKLYPRNTNPRWIAYHAHLGRTFQTYEFILWIGQRWRDLAEVLDVKPDAWGATPSSRIAGAYGMGKAHALFDRFIGVPDKYNTRRDRLLDQGETHVRR